MSSGFIRRGQIYERNGRRFLITDVLETGHLLVEDVENGGKRRFVSIESLLRQWLARRIILRGAPGQDLRCVADLDPRERLEQLNEHARAIVEQRLKIIEAVDGLPSATKCIDSHLREVWPKLGIPGDPPTGSTVCRWRRRLRLANGDIQALVPAHCRKGPKPTQLHEETERAIRDAMSQVWLKRERGTRHRVWEVAYYNVLMKNQGRLPEHTIPLPTRHQVRQVMKSLSAYHDFEARHGREAARNVFRKVLRDRDREVRRALEEVQFDHTLMDVFVLDDQTGLVRGRPWITACIDRLTRCIVGIWIGFTPPSYSTLAKCLRHAILPKLDLKATYPKIKMEWEAFGIPENAVVDNGLEFHGHNFERVCRRLGIVIAAAPRRSGWSKGLIERIFRTLNVGLVHNLPGRAFSNILERGDYDPEKNAAIRLSVLRKLVTTFIVDVYHQTVHATLQTTPADMWRKHAADIRLPCSIDDLKYVFDKTETRSLSHAGVRIMGLQYNSEELAQMFREFGPSTPVEVGYDADDLTAVRVTHVESGWMLDVPAVRQDYVAGLDEWQHLMIRQIVKEDGKNVENIEHLLEAKHRLDELVQKELARKGKRGSKRLHRLLRDSSTSVEPASTTPSTDSQTISDETPSRDAAPEQDYFEPTKPLDDVPDVNPIPMKPKGEEQ